MQQGMNFSVRIGLNSGEVVVGTIGDDLRMEYTAQGHVVGLAQRMEQVAAADRIALSEHTARLVAPYFDLRDLGRLQLKGASEPVRVFELEGAGSVRTRLDAARSRGFTRFVGREREIAALDAALQRALGGETQIVGVVGEPGVGKSRLCLELLARARAQAIPVYEGHCLSHGRALPFHPVLQLYRAYFGIHESDPPAEARRKIAGTLLLQDDRLREALPLLFDFLGVPDPERPPPRLDPEARQRQLVAFTGEVVAGAQRARAGGAADRRPALDRPRQRGLPGAHHRGDERDADPHAAQLPPRVPRRVDAARRTTSRWRCGRSGRRRSRSCCGPCSAATPRSRRSSRGCASAPAATRFSPRSWSSRWWKRARSPAPRAPIA